MAQCNIAHCALEPTGNKAEYEQQNIGKAKKPMLWIRIGFNADPVPGCQTNADPCESEPWSDFKVTKVEFSNEKYI
jgi:hypothetical protein